MPGQDGEWTDDQRALYDECHAIGQAWADDPDTPADQLQEVVNLAEAGEDDLDGVEIGHPPLIDAVSEATGEVVASVTARRDDPAFAGFVAGVRDGVAGDVFGL